MRKQLLLIVAVLISLSMASAQTLKLTNSETAPKAKLFRTNVIPSMPVKAQPAVFSAVSKHDFDGISALKAPAATLTAKYQRPAGTMYVGYGSDFYGFPPLIVGKANVDWEFQNRSEGATSYEWTINNTTEGLSVASNGNMTYKPESISLYYIPEIMAKSDASSDSWYYGKNIKDVSYNNCYLSASTDVLPLTNAEHYYGGFYFGFQDGYGFGTVGEIQPGEKVTGVLTSYNKPQAPLLIQGIGSFIYTNGTTPLSNNGKLTMTVYKRSADGQIGDAVAVSDLYKDELIQSGDLFYTPFRFTEYDEITGLETETNLIIDYPFAIELTWDDPNADFGVAMAQNTYEAGSAYATTDKGNAYRYGKWNTDHTVFVNMYDVYFVLNAVYPTFETFEPTQKVTVPNEGGLAAFTYDGEIYNNIIIQSTFTFEDIKVTSIPDWLKLEGFENEMQTETGEEYFTNTVYAYFSGDPLPSNLTGRAGIIVLDLYGIPTTIQVKQGDANWMGTPSVKPVSVTKAVRQGDSFQLTYPQGTTSVAVYTVTGQKVAEYQLNAKGTTSIPAANWAKGVYVLKFTGKTSGTVKVIK